MNQPTADQIYCPICQKPNRCEVDQPKGCWCMKVTVPAALLATLPPEMKNKSCICESCIAQFKQQFHQENSAQ